MNSHEFFLKGWPYQVLIDPNQMSLRRTPASLSPGEIVRFVAIDADTHASEKRVVFIRPGTDELFTITMVDQEPEPDWAAFFAKTEYF